MFVTVLRDRGIRLFKPATKTFGQVPVSPGEMSGKRANSNVTCNLPAFVPSHSIRHNNKHSSFARVITCLRRKATRRILIVAPDETDMRGIAKLEEGHARLLLR
jgi:hypothetical protein